MCFLSAVAKAPRITRIDRVERLIGCSDLSYRQRQHRQVETDSGPRTARTLAAGITISFFIVRLLQVRTAANGCKT